VRKCGGEQDGGSQSWAGVLRTSLASRLFGCRPKRRGVGAASHAHPPSCTSSSVDQTSLPPPTLRSRCLLMSPSLQPLAAIMDPPWLRENGGSRAIAQRAPHVGAEWPENRRMRSCEWTATRQPPRMQSVPTPMEGPPGSDDLVDRALVLLRHQFLRGVPQSGPSGKRVSRDVMSHLDEVLVLGRRTRSSDKRISVSSETSRHLCLSASSVMSAGSLSVPSRSKGLPKGSQQGEVRHVSARKGKWPRKPARPVRRVALSKGSEGQTAS
jgi:hypothetical protein